MTLDEQRRALRDAIQTDPGHRGLARDPTDNLFTCCPDDFAQQHQLLFAIRIQNAVVCFGNFMQS